MATSVSECVSEDGHRGEITGVVHLPREGGDGGSAPFRKEIDRTERVTEDLAHDSREENIRIFAEHTEVIRRSVAEVFKCVPVEISPEIVGNVNGGKC